MALFDTNLLLLLLLTLLSWYWRPSDTVARWRRRWLWCCYCWWWWSTAVRAPARASYPLRPLPADRLPAGRAIVSRRRFTPNRSSPSHASGARVDRYYRAVPSLCHNTRLTGIRQQCVCVCDVPRPVGVREPCKSCENTRENEKSNANRRRWRFFKRLLRPVTCRIMVMRRPGTRNVVREKKKKKTKTSRVLLL